MIPFLLFQLSSGAASSVPEAAKADLLVADQRRTINVQNVVKSLRIGPHRRRLHVRGR